MLKRAFWLGMLLVATQLSTGCCCWQRPYIFQRCCWRPAGCGFGCGSSGSCGCDAGPMAVDYGPAPATIPGGTMPNAVPVVRR